MTAVATLLAGIRATLAAATRGPWEEKTDCRERPSVWKDEEYAFPIGMCADSNCNSEAVYEEADAAFIASAPVTVARLLAAVDAVVKVHEPVDALMNPGRHERVVKVCTGCGTDDGNWLRYPCPTITAVTAALGGGE